MPQGVQARRGKRGRTIDPCTIRCTLCGNVTKVLDSRLADAKSDPARANTIRRRRECVKCATRFSTIEQFDACSLPNHVEEEWEDLASKVRTAIRTWYRNKKGETTPDVSPSELR